MSAPERRGRPAHWDAPGLRAYRPHEVTVDGLEYVVEPGGAGRVKVYQVADTGQRRKVRETHVVQRVLAALDGRARTRAAIEAMGSPPESGQEETVGQRVGPPEAPPGSDTGGSDG